MEQQPMNILQTFMLQAVVFAEGGLQDLQDTIINNWLGPVFIVAVAAFAIVFIKDRAWMKLLGFVGIAAIVGVLIFAGDAFFGDEGSLKGTAEGLAEDIK